MQSQQVQEELSALKSIYGEDKIEVQDSVVIINPCKDQQIKLAAFISECYPDDPPIVTVEGLNDVSAAQKQDIEEKLLKVSMESVGEPMLYTLAVELQEWLESNQSNQLQQNNHESVEGEEMEEQQIYHIPQTARSEMMSVVSKQNYEKGGKGGKKPPMKTARDVIKRIQWDERLDSLHFTVGYEDRFLGILEKPFNDFKWQDLATVELHDLAIPQHRIQYFKYKGVIVWDKGAQMDNVFGSRGGCTIYDVLDEVEEREQVERDLDQDIDFESGEEEEEQFLGGVEGEGEGEEELPQQMSSAQDSSKHENDAQVTYKKSSKRPNFFLCFKVDNQEIIDKVNQVQQYILSQDGRLEELFIPLQALHITLCMLKLKNEEELNIARSVLRQSQSTLAAMLTSNGVGNQVDIKGVLSFRDRVIYADVTNPGQGLSQAVKFLREKFVEAQIPVPDDYRDFKPHLTILKMSPSKSYQLNMKFIDRGLYFPYTHTNFGSQKVEQLQLCSVNSPFQKNGFYLTLLKLPLLGQNENSPEILECLKHVYESWKEREDIQMKDGFHEEVQQIFDGSSVDMVQLQNLVQQNMDDKLEGFLLILRGIPGIGRSYTANYLSGKYSNQVAIIDFSGESVRNGSRIEQVVDAVKAGAWFVIVEGILQNRWEYNSLVEFASAINFGVQIVELSCSAGTMGLKFVASRSKQKHKNQVSLQIIENMLNNWEVDERARMVEAYVEKVGEANDPCMEIQQISEEFTNRIRHVRKQTSNNKQFIKYSAIFLPHKQKKKLLDAFGCAFEVVQGDHITLQYLPSIEDVQNLPLGTEVQVSVEGVAQDSQVQVVKVDIKKNDLSNFLSFKIPHITVSHQYGVPPALSTSLLNYNDGEKIKAVLPQQRITLDGIVGCLVDTSNTQDQKCQAKVFDHNTLNCYYKQYNNRMIDAQQDVELCLGPQQAVTTLFVFDFDGTLYDHPENRSIKLSQEGTNITAVDTFVLDQKTALIPCQGIPLYRRYCGSAGSSTIILTGRWCSYEEDIKGLLKREGLPLPDKFLFKPRELEQPTTEFKVNTLQQILTNEYTDVRKVWILDDLPEILAAYSRFSETEFGKKFEFEIHDVAGQNEIYQFGQPLFKEVASLQRDSLYKYLARYGYFPDNKFIGAAESGLEFILDIWSNTLGYEEDKQNLLLIQGGFAMGRKGDVDITLLSPYAYKQSDCARKLCDGLECSGVQFVYLSPASALPRVRCKLQFQENYSVEYDIVFCRVNREVYKNGYTDIDTLAGAIQEDDEASRRVVESQKFYSDYQNAISNFRSGRGSDFVAITVESLVQIFKTFRMHGSTFHCPRTIHLTQLVIQTVAELNKKNNNLIVINSSFELLIQVIVFAKTWAANRWKKLFGKFVPQNYIADIINIFDTISNFEYVQNAIQQIQSNQFNDSLITQQFLDQQETNPYFQLFIQPKIQLQEMLDKGYEICGLKISGNSQNGEIDEVAAWQLGVFVEARAQGYVRKIIEAGTELKPWLFEVDEKQKQILFQVLVLKSKFSDEIVKTHLTDLMNEVQSFISVEIVFL